MQAFNFITLPPRAIANLKAIDYAEAPVGSLSYALLANASKNAEQKQMLYRQLSQQTITEPIIVTKRITDHSNAWRLVDGHHRACVSLEKQTSLDAWAHLCACPASSLDFLGLCPPIAKLFATYASVKA